MIKEALSVEDTLKLALEALEGLIKKTSGQSIYSFMETERRIAMSACVGIKEALAQPERHELQADGKHPAPCARFCEANAFQVELRRLKAQLLKQPAVTESHKQEPVAWGNFKEDGTLVGLSQHPEDQSNWTGRKPLYTTPYVATPRPQRTAAEGEDTRRAWVHATEWRGLTDEEIEACFHHVDEAGIGLFDFAEAIEAKLKEKNA